MSIKCTFAEFKGFAKEFHEAAGSLNLEELENAWKCLSLAYMNMAEPMWEHSAATLLNMEAKVYFDRLFALLQAEKRASCCVTDSPDSGRDDVNPDGNEVHETVLYQQH